MSDPLEGVHRYFADPWEVILRLLESDPREWYGLELVRASGGRLKRGTVYLHTRDLELNGWISSREEDQPKYAGASRRLYRLTEDGRRELDRKRDRGTAGLVPVPA